MGGVASHMFQLQKKITPGTVLSVFIMINLIIGLLIVKDYGISMDERREVMRAEMALRAYAFRPDVNYNKIGLAQVYGTAQSVLFQLADNILRPMLGTGPRVVAHYGYFMTFQVAILGCYFLAKRFINGWGALSVALLFGTQPLYFGHAFINPKDIPLMAVFLCTVTLGLNMADRLLESSTTQSGLNALDLVKEDWQTFKARNLWWMFPLNLTLAALLVFAAKVKSWLGNFVVWAYHQPNTSLAGQLFSRIASQKAQIPVEQYIEKIKYLYTQYALWLVVAIMLIQVMLVVLPKFTRAVFALRLFSPQPLVEFGRVFRNPLFVFAAVVWGLCLGTRMIGVAAGGMVGLYFLLRGRERAIVPLIGYTTIAFVVLFIAWPYLWHTGFSGLAQSFLLLEDFPVKLSILFGGRLYTGRNLPPGYLPILMAIQLTLPLVILAITGACIAIYRWTNSQTEKTQLFIISAWLLLPMLYVILSGTNLYHNFRQLLFITPPLFIIAGFTLDALFKRVTKRWLQVLLIAMFLLPGLLSIVRLHPYQYVYYNQLVGGVRGAYRNYDLDYWMTSIKEATEHANQELPPDSKLNGWYAGSNYIALYLRDDIQLLSHREFHGPQGPAFEYVLLPTWADYDLRHYKYGVDIYQVTAGDAVLMVLRQVK